MEIKTARDLLKGEWGGEKEKIVPFFFLAFQFALACERSECTVELSKKKNFCGQAMFNHSYLQSIFEKEVSKIAMVMSVKTNGIPNPPKPTAPSHHPPSFRLPKYIVVHNHGSITLSSK